MREHEHEPVPGLPEALPVGEQIIWQGRPGWQGLAKRALHVRAVAAYFAILFTWSMASSISAGETPAAAAIGVLRIAPLAAVALGLLALYAYLIHRAAMYTVTSRRIVMRFGVALPVTMNIPFAQIENAAMKDHGDGTQDITLRLAGPDRQSFIVMWPHVRPWWTTKPQPMLRCIPQAEGVAAKLAGALKAYAPAGTVYAPAQAKPVAANAGPAGATPAAA